MTNTQETYTVITESMKSFSEKLEPYAERFFGFIQNYNTRGYVDTDIAVYPDLGWDHAKFSDFKIVFDLPDYDYYDKGVRYDAYDTDTFVMPYAYMDDPEAWEKALVERMENDRIAALEAMKTDFPGMLDEEDESKVTFWMKKVENRTKLLLLNLSETKLASDDSMTTKFNGKHYLIDGGLGYNPLTGHIEMVTDAENLYTIRDGQWVPLVEV